MCQMKERKWSFAWKKKMKTVKLKLENVTEEYDVGYVSFSDWKRKEAKLKSGVLTELQVKVERREEIKNMKNVDLKMREAIIVWFICQ